VENPLIGCQQIEEKVLYFHIKSGWGLPLCFTLIPQWFVGPFVSAPFCKFLLVYYFFKVRGIRWKKMFDEVNYEIFKNDRGAKNVRLFSLATSLPSVSIVWNCSWQSLKSTSPDSPYSFYGNTPSWRCRFVFFFQKKNKEF
jgi:hypothetical protein